MRISGLIYSIIILILVAAVIFLSWRLLSGDPVSFGNSPEDSEEELPLAQEESYPVNPMYKTMLAGGFPAVVAADGSSGSIFSGLLDMITREDMRDPKTIIEYPMPYLSEASDAPDNAPDNAVKVFSTLPGRSSVDRSKAPIDISRADSDEDSYSEVSDDIKILIDQIEVDTNPIELTGEGPKILVYSSHSRESYRQDPKDPYKEAFSEAFRTDDQGHSVIKVAETLSQQLTSRGIAVLHDRANHEAGDYNASYGKSLNTLKKQMAENKSLQVFIDVHRNGYDEDSGKKPDDEVVVINGERTAKLLVVIGTGEGIMGGFNEKPKWEENAKLAIKLTNKINELFPGLAKDVLYKTGRYNQHVSTNAILVEVGSNFTTLVEAERATKYLAEAISQIIE
jgi:stage II sporulation protein P